MNERASRSEFGMWDVRHSKIYDHGDDTVRLYRNDPTSPEIVHVYVVRRIRDHDVVGVKIVMSDAQRLEHYDRGQSLSHAIQDRGGMMFLQINQIRQGIVLVF
jgi:hypothetical protein